MYSENLYKQTRKEGKQWGKIGFDASRATSGLFQSLGYDQAKEIASLFPMLMGSMRNAASWMSPGSQQSQIDAYRNQALQSAQRTGANSANTARWMGLGSGTQSSLIDSAGQRANNAIGGFVQNMYSPAYQANQFGALSSLMNPTFAQLGQSLKSGQNSAYPNKNANLLPSILSAGASMAGMGGFGNIFGGAAAATQAPIPTINFGGLGYGAGSLGSGNLFGNTMPIGGGFGGGFTIPVTYP